MPGEPSTDDTPGAGSPRRPGTAVRALALVVALVVFTGGAVAVQRWRDDRAVTATRSPGEGGSEVGDGPGSGPDAAPGTTATDPTGLEPTGLDPTGAGPTTADSTAPATTTTIVSTGRFVTSPGTGAVHGTGPLHTYRTEVEEGTGVDPAAFASVVDAILADQRGWIGVDGVSFQRVDGPTASFTITLATPDTTDQICLPLRTNGKFSCREGTRAILNLRRWLEGTTDLPLSVDDYRAAVVNHEVGHVLGHGHLGCGGAGKAAPVMMQQSKGLDGCRANPWPALDGT